MTEFRFRQAARESYSARIKRELQGTKDISEELAKAIENLREEISSKGS